MKQLSAVLVLAAFAGIVEARPATAVFLPATPPAAASASAAAVASPGTPQRSRMKACNADAKVKALHGDDRRAFMKQCLSGKADKAPAR